MDDKVFTEEEIKTIEEIVTRYLEPISGELKIETPPTHFRVRINELEHNEYLYHCKFHTNNGDIETREFFPETADDIAQIAWNIACSAWQKIDGDIKSELANNLWPDDNDRKPDYGRFLS